MKNIIVGTSGHIDHGKSLLIKAITNKETDRLKEEKNRGITIELGFSNLENDKNLDIGIIDVPGHEKFVRHMLSGVGGIDIVLLVVAADEGFMPQTVEHFEILKSIGVKKGIIVLTKIDLVDKELKEIVKEDIREHVKDSFLETAKIMEVSSVTGYGIEELKKEILNMAEECDEKKNYLEIFRLPIDRVFTIKGHGVVVTGTLIEGSVKVNDEVMIYPNMKLAKVRGLQVHSKPVDQAFAGQRTAINLANIKKEEINRGCIVAFKDSLFNSNIIDVRIDMFKSGKRILKNNSLVHFYYGAAELLCKVILLDKEELHSGESAYAQIKFNEPVALKRNDRFILRFYSPTETIAGGKVINSLPKKKKRFNEDVINNLKKLDCSNLKSAVEEFFLEESPNLRNFNEILILLNEDNNIIKDIVNELIEDTLLIRLEENFIIHGDYLKNIKNDILQILKKFHSENPFVLGINKEEFRKKIEQFIKKDDFKKLEYLIKYLEKINFIKENNSLISLYEFKIQYGELEKNKINDILDKYKKFGVEPESIDEFLKKYKEDKLIKQLIFYLISDEKLVMLNNLYFIENSVLEDAKNKLIEYIKNNGKITLAEYRNLLSTSRKYCIMLLEYFDNQKITKMVDDYRILL